MADESLSALDNPQTWMSPGFLAATTPPPPPVFRTDAQMQPRQPDDDFDVDSFISNSPEPSTAPQAKPTQTPQDFSHPQFGGEDPFDVDSFIAQPHSKVFKVPTPIAHE